MIRRFRKWYNLTLSPESSLAWQLEKLLGFSPCDLSLYKLALHHRSTYAEVLENNERLELLGDAVLGLCVTDELYFYYPEREEGFLTEMRSKVVNRIQLNSLAHAIGLHELIEHSASAEDFAKSSIPGNALESLVGAIYLDGGYALTRKFVHEKLLTPHINFETLRKATHNFKSKLLEWCQKRKKRLSFKSLEEVREGTKWSYTMGAFIEGKLFGQGTDSSKKKAEQRAASQAIEKLQID